MQKYLSSFVDTMKQGEQREQGKRGGDISCWRYFCLLALGWRLYITTRYRELCRGGFHYYRFFSHPDATKPAPTPLSPRRAMANLYQYPSFHLEYME